MDDEVVLAASAVMTDGAGRVLLIKRGREPNRGLWSLPGGRVEPGETPQQAVGRETAEETGLRVAVGRELWAFQATAPNGQTYKIHTFAVRVTAGALRPDDDAADARWVDPSEIDLLPLTPNLADYLRRAGVIA